MTMQTANPGYTRNLHGNLEDRNYSRWLAAVQTVFNNATGPLFVADIDPEKLWETYINSFEDPARKQHHNCHCCRTFIKKFSGLVFVDDDGHARPALWNENLTGATEEYQPELLPALLAMTRLLQNVKVKHVFLHEDAQWGHPLTASWRHLSVRRPAHTVYRRTTLTGKQAMAEKRENFVNVVLFLGWTDQGVLNQVAHIASSDALYRAEKIEAPAQWLANLKGILTNKRMSLTQRHNLLWLAVAEAPNGFCHPNSSVLGTLIEDLKTMSPAEAAKKFKAKMRPEIYQRPQAAPKAGTITQAEKIVQQLGVERSLYRRMVREEEVHAIWRPKAGGAATGAGVFGHLRARDAQPQAPAKGLAETMTWVKFFEKVLPSADKIEIWAPAHSGGYGALTTATHEDAPPILQWDFPEKRNPISWYGWVRGAYASQYKLTANEWYPVNSLSFRPSMEAGLDQHGNGVFFSIEGARETRQAGLAIFPETLKGEFHGIRSVVEAHSNSRQLDGIDQPHVAGLYFSGKGSEVRLRVTARGMITEYTLDRWD
jgi:hypothetical protein